MRYESTKTHGLIDYATGLLLMGCPWLLGFYDGSLATWTPVLVGAMAILYSLMTKYEWGIVKVFPMHYHRWFDALSGVVLALFPWLFGFADRVFLPHLLIGLLEIRMALVTRTAPVALKDRPHPIGPPFAAKKMR